MTDLPIACTLTAAERAQRQDLLPALLAAADHQDTVPNGLRWRFAPDPAVLPRLVEVITAERLCCRFLHFRIDAEPDQGPVWLEATGPDGTREFLEGLVKGS